MTKTELVAHIEAWLKTDEARTRSCVRDYQPGYAPFAFDFKPKCPGCLLIQAHLELIHSAGDQSK